MALNDGTLNLMGEYLKSIIGNASLHTADPGAAGANETTAGRLAPAFTVDADGDLTLNAPLGFTGGASSGPCTHVGLWAPDGTTFRGGYQLTGDQAFNAAGEYTLGALTINGTAS